MTSDPLRVYKQTRVKTASQGQLIVMLYDEGLKQLKAAESELKRDPPKLDSAHNAIVKAQDVITELMVSLDFDKGGDIAQNLFSSVHVFQSETRRCQSFQGLIRDYGGVHLNVRSS